MSTPHGHFGVLTVDVEADRLLCHVCGRWYRSLAQHARRAHGVNASEYRHLAGLNRQTRLVSPGMREHLREVTAPLIARLRAGGMLRRWDEDPEKWARDKAAAVSTIHTRGIQPEGRRHRREGISEEDRDHMAERTRNRNLAGELRATPAAIREGLRRAAGTGTCEDCHVTYQRTMPRQRRCPQCANEAQRRMSRESAARRRLRNREGER